MDPIVQEIGVQLHPDKRFDTANIGKGFVSGEIEAGIEIDSQFCVGGHRAKQNEEQHSQPGEQSEMTLSVLCPNSIHELPSEGQPSGPRPRGERRNSRALNSVVWNALFANTAEDIGNRQSVALAPDRTNRARTSNENGYHQSWSYPTLAA